MAISVKQDWPIAWGAWFRAFRSLTEGAYPELRAAFARSVASNFDGHDSKNAWIYELAPARYLSLTDAASKLGVKTSRLRVMLMHMPVLEEVVSPPTKSIP